MTTDASSLPLSGIVVLDLTRVLAGPYCTRQLSDMGATVIKVERPEGGDDTRNAPFQLEPGRRDQSSYFARVNAGKQGVGIDLASPEGLAVLLDLARHADVFIENFAPGVVSKLGCDVEAVRRVKPDIVYCSISGYGQTGQWHKRPAFAHTTNAISGMMHLEQGDAENPRASNLQAADVLAAAHAASAIVAALFRRFRTGQGAFIDVSMLEALIGADSVSYPSVLNGGEPYGNPRPGMVVHRVGDRHLVLQIVGAGDLWPRLLKLMNRPELASDVRFATQPDRVRHWPELNRLIGEWLDATYATVDDALAALEAARVPCAPVLYPEEVIASRHLAERAFFPTLQHPVAGAVRVTASPYHLDGRPVHPRTRAPHHVGEHTREVLAGRLGYDAARIEALFRSGAVSGPG
ncbi:MAG: CaiB/BaiF CoA transferase family protein [Burkholderiales bacterium]|jgi:crotonobetainyl-CoA:carnitine CoA-transferase CaiB-like acyl-CoA transferase